MYDPIVYGLDTKGEVLGIIREDNINLLSGVVDQASKLNNTTKIEVFNFTKGFDNRDGDVFMCSPDGLVKTIKQIRKLNFTALEHKGRWLGQVNKLIDTGGVLIEISNTGCKEATMSPCRSIYSYPGKNLISTWKVEGSLMHDNYSFYLFVPEEELRKKPTGIYVPQTGQTISLNQHALKNRHIGVNCLDGKETHGGVRLNVRFPDSSRKPVFSSINGMVNTYSSCIHSGETIESVDVYVTTVDGERLLGSASIEEAIHGILIKGSEALEGKEYFLKLYETEQEARSSINLKERELQMEIEALKDSLEVSAQRLKTVQEEAKLSASQQKQSWFGKLTTAVSNIIAPAVKLIVAIFSVVVL